LWAQKYFPARLDKLQPHSDRSGVFEFVLDLETDEQTFNSVMFKYNNQEAVVEPRHYDQCLNNLRDHLRKAKTIR
jgi:hypothetical protein